MRFIKAFLVGITGLFIVITLLSLLLPSEIKVSRAVVLNTTTGKAYTQISNLHNWKNWEPLFASDSAVKTFRDAVPGKNASCDIRYGEKQVHVEITTMDSVSVQFAMEENGGYRISNEINIAPVQAQNEVQVEWKALTKLHWYPWDKFYGIFIDRLTGPDYDEALNNLKSFLEKN